MEVNFKVNTLGNLLISNQCFASWALEESLVSVDFMHSSKVSKRFQQKSLSLDLFQELRVIQNKLKE